MADRFRGAHPAVAMISIKRYMDVSGGNLYRPTIELLAETVSRHPFDFDHAEATRFKADIGGVLDRLGDEVSDEQFTDAVEGIHQALDRHNQAASELFRDQSNELQNMIVMLTQAMRSLMSSSKISAQNLDTIASDLKQASALPDICRLRLRLSECLKKVCDEASRHKDVSQGSLQVLKEKLAESQQRLSLHGLATDLDRVTGFAGRATAEAAIRRAIDEGGSRFIIIAVLERMPTINALFGYAVGDELLCEFAAALAGHMASRAVFYRWNGPAVLGILQRSVPIHVVRAEVGRVLSEIRISKSIADRDQNGLITTSAASQVVVAAAPVDALIAGIDEFVLSKNQERNPRLTPSPPPPSRITCS